MKTSKISEMIRGWFIGNFSPTVWKTEDFEVAIQRYKAGDTETPHIHRVATEINVVTEGAIEMNGKAFMVDDIVIIEPGEKAHFKALTDAAVVVVKVPSLIGDKYTE